MEAQRGVKSNLAVCTEAASVLARAESFDAAAGAAQQQQLWRATSNAIKVWFVVFICVF